MIPKTAFFYWTGGPLPWLRERALTSFQKLHPEWHVVLGSPEDRNVPAGVTLLRYTVTDPLLPPAARSDVWRWHALHKYGGVFSDTDVVFVKPIEVLFQEEKDVWLTLDMGTPVPHYGVKRRSRHAPVEAMVSVSIGIVGARRGSLFMSRLAELARRTPVSSDYQSHGTTLITKNWKELYKDVEFGPIYSHHFYPYTSSHKEVIKLWQPGQLAEELLGVHWYGGSPASTLYGQVQCLADLPESLVKTALCVSET